MVLRHPEDTSAISVRRGVTNTREQELRIISYARYSTDEQHETSIPDQFAGNERHLSRIAVSGKVDQLSDAEMSGELVSRPGINQVREGIKAGSWDLLICEDSSRLFRHDTAPIELVHLALDAGIRVICINDYVDTTEPGWEDRLSDAVKHHARSNRYTSLRIKRRLEALWREGAAIGLLQPGYTRTGSVPATARTPEQGPFFDHVDPGEARLIKEAFERVARNERPWATAEWLTAEKLRKSHGPFKHAWTAKDVVALIRRDKYRGVEHYRHQISEKKFTSGKRVPKRNDPKNVLARNMPHLRIVEDSLWYGANAAINARRNNNRTVAGKEHPLTGVPRDSRGPLSEVFFCFCGEKMYAEGRNEGGYRCRGAKRGTCWNLATCLRNETHAAISTAIAGHLLQVLGTVDFLVDQVESRFMNDDLRKDQDAKLAKLVAELCRRRDRLVNAIESGDEAPQVLVQRLSECEAELAISRGELECLRAESTSASNRVTREQIEDVIERVKGQVLSFGRDVGGLLRSLIPNGIHAVPYQQFGSNKVVLRAEFELNLLSELPKNVSRLWSGDTSELAMQGHLIQSKCSVNLFEPSIVPKYAAEAYRLHSECSSKQSYEKIGQILGISKPRAAAAVRLGKAMAMAGITDPFVRLTERPANPSRWGGRD